MDNNNLICFIAIFRNKTKIYIPINQREQKETTQKEKTTYGTKGQE